MYTLLFSSLLLIARCAACIVSCRGVVGFHAVCASYKLLSEKPLSQVKIAGSPKHLAFADLFSQATKAT